LFMENMTGVSVCIFTYNYEKYLAQAIDSVLMQVTAFPVEIVIGDDCSTDGTRGIAQQYKDRFPDKITLSFNEVNIGGTRNWIRTMNRCKGKYLAFLDGDDYFTHPLKLQKQFDALEANPDFVLCFHGVEEKYDDIVGHDKVVIFEKEVYELRDFLSTGWFIRTASTFFRNGLASAAPPEWVYRFPYRYDTILHVFLCMQGKALFLPDVMSVWRKHSKGMSKAMHDKVIWNIETEVSMARQLDEYTGFRYTREVKAYIRRCYSDLFVRILNSKGGAGRIPALFRSMRKMDYGRTWQTFKRKLVGN
jgi:glycosyltransferase involved in cell wall biosynthesis